MVWGWNPDSVAALGQVSGALFAAVASLVAGLGLWRQSQQIKSLRQAEKRRGAEGVAAWVGWWQPEPRLGRRRDADDMMERLRQGTAGYHVYLRNAGDTPIYRCKVRAVRRDPGFSGDIVDDHDFGTVAPGDTLNESLKLKTDDLDLIGIEVTFFDSAGRRWRRDGRGALSEMQTADSHVGGLA